MSGFFDAAQAGLAVRRTFKDGDVRASRAYVAAGVFYGVGAVAGVTAAAYGMATIFSLLGAAIVFGLIGYMLYRRAYGLESTSLERWVRRCFFGYANEIPKVHWCSFHAASTAIAELNSVVIGVQADLNFKNEFVVSSDSVLTRPGQLSPDPIIAESLLTFKMGCLPIIKIWQPIVGDLYFIALKIVIMVFIMRGKLSGKKIIERLHLLLLGGSV